MKFAQIYLESFYKTAEEAKPVAPVAPAKPTTPAVAAEPPKEDMFARMARRKAEADQAKKDKGIVSAEPIEPVKRIGGWIANRIFGEQKSE